jgi:hypothetical protein
MNLRSAITAIIAIAVLAIGAIWLVPGVVSPQPDTKRILPPVGPTALPAVRPTMPAEAPQANQAVSFRAPNAGGKPSSACASCEAEQCKDLLSVCDKQVGNAAEGPQAGKPKGELCRQLVTCVRDTGCGSKQVIDCYCGSADATECNSGKANGACLSAFQAAAETTAPSTALERTSDTAYAAGAASSLLMCDEDACRKDCLPYYR